MSCNCSIVCAECWQAMKSNCLSERKKKKVHITPVQQMLSRFEALQKMTSAAVKQSCSVDTSAAVKQSAGRADSTVNNTAAVCDSTKVACASKPKQFDGRVAHKPTLVRAATFIQCFY